LVLLLSLLLKLGLFPFQFWVYSVLKGLQLTDLCFFVGPIKAGLLWLLVCSSATAYFFVSASVLLGILLLWSSCSVQLLLFGSSLCQPLIYVCLGSIIFPLYFSFYLFSLLGVSLSDSPHLSPFIAYLRLGSLPPFSIFWAKVLAISSLPSAFALLVLVISVLTLWPYVRFAFTLPSPTPSSPSLLLLLVLAPFLILLLWS